MKNLDWQHVALALLSALCLGLLLWAGAKLPSPALLQVAVPASTLFLTQLLSLLKGSPLQPDPATLAAKLLASKPPAPEEKASP